MRRAIGSSRSGGSDYPGVGGGKWKEDRGEEREREGRWEMRECDVSAKELYLALVASPRTARWWTVEDHRAAWRDAEEMVRAMAAEEYAAEPAGSAAQDHRPLSQEPYMVRNVELGEEGDEVEKRLEAKREELEERAAREAEEREEELRRIALNPETVAEREAKEKDRVRAELEEARRIALEALLAAAARRARAAEEYAAEPAGGPAEERRTVRELLRRVAELERENVRLRDALEAEVDDGWEWIPEGGWELAEEGERKEREQERVHELKVWPEFFAQVVAGRKRFEIRPDDRGFKVGDEVKLREWDPKCYKEDVPFGYTGSECSVRVTYITDFGQPSKKGVRQVVLGISEPWAVLSNREGGEG